MIDNGWGDETPPGDVLMQPYIEPFDSYEWERKVVEPLDIPIGNVAVYPL